MCVFDVRLRDVALDTGVLLEDVESRQAEVALLVFEKLFAQTHVPEKEVLVEGTRKARKVLVRDFGLKHKAFSEHQVRTKPTVLIKKGSVELGLERIADFTEIRI